jgi:hypothetical protein
MLAAYAAAFMHIKASHPVGLAAAGVKGCTGRCCISCAVVIITLAQKIGTQTDMPCSAHLAGTQMAFVCAPAASTLWEA